MYRDLFKKIVRKSFGLPTKNYLKIIFGEKKDLPLSVYSLNLQVILRRLQSFSG